MDTFQTVSGSEKRVRTIVCILIVMTGLGFAGLLRSVAFFLFLEAMIWIWELPMIFLTKRAVWELSFEGNKLYLTNKGNKKQYVVYDVPASDFICKQSKEQAVKNWGDVTVRGTIFQMQDVRNFSELVAYVEGHF